MSLTPIRRIRITWISRHCYGELLRNIHIPSCKFSSTNCSKEPLAISFRHQERSRFLRMVLSSLSTTKMQMLIYFIYFLILLDASHVLRVHLCADEIVIITIEPRTGRLTFRGTGDLAAAGRGLRFAAINEKLDDNPTILSDALVRLRFHVSDSVPMSIEMWWS